MHSVAWVLWWMLHSEASFCFCFCCLFTLAFAFVRKSIVSFCLNTPNSIAYRVYFLRIFLRISHQFAFLFVTQSVHWYVLRQDSFRQKDGRYHARLDECSGKTVRRCYELNGARIVPLPQPAAAFQISLANGKKLLLQPESGKSRPNPYTNRNRNPKRDREGER